MSRLNSDDLQFAYKSGCSTTQCVSVLCETIDYYVHNESDVYMCSIDAFKAFDRVNILLLFRKLRKRNFCPLFLRYLVNSYCNQMMMVRWNGSLSDKLDVTNGVKVLEKCRKNLIGHSRLAFNNHESNIDC